MLRKCNFAKAPALYSFTAFSKASLYRVLLEFCLPSRNHCTTVPTDQRGLLSPAAWASLYLTAGVWDLWQDPSLWPLLVQMLQGRVWRLPGASAVQERFPKFSAGPSGASYTRGAKLPHVLLHPPLQFGTK